MQHLPDPTDVGWPGEALNRHHVLGLVQRQAITVIAICLTFLIAGIVFVIFSKPYYTASTQLLVEPTIESVFEQKSGRVKGPVDLVELDSQVEIIKSYGLAGQVADELDLKNIPAFASNTNHLQGIISNIRAALSLQVNLQEDKTKGGRQLAISKLRKNLSAVRLGNSKVVEIKYTSYDPAMAANLANAFAEQYLTARQRDDSSANLQKLSWLKQRVAELKQQMIASSLAVQKFRNKNSKVDEMASNRSAIIYDLERKALTYRGLYTTFLIRLQEASQRQSFVTRHGRVVSAALQPVVPSFPNVKLVLVVSVALGVFAGMGIAACREW